jgi:hypothetical protein
MRLKIEKLGDVMLSLNNVYLGKFRTLAHIISAVEKAFVSPIARWNLDVTGA